MSYEQMYLSCLAEGNENIEEHQVDSENHSDTFKSLPKRRKWEGYCVNVNVVYKEFVDLFVL